MSGEKKAHFQKVKEENKRLIRNLLLKKEGLGISNLARESELSYPTVASLISELMKEGQVNILEEAESCGGRPGLRYALNPEYRQGLVLVLMAEGLHGVVYDACGKVIKEYRREVSSDLTAEQLVAEIAGIQAENSNLTDIALGIPGAVHEHEITHLPRFPHLLGSELAERIKGKTKASFCLENDLNAIVLTEVNEYRDFAHIAWIEGCIGVGIVLNGQVIKGSQGYAGEVDGLFVDGEAECIRLAKCIVALTCVLNLPHVFVSGRIYEAELIARALREVEKCIPKERIPQIHIVEDVQGLCQRGLWKRILQKWKNEI